MDFLSNFYSKTVAENERNLRFWEDYLKNLKELDFKAYSDKLTVPVLVPIGSRILLRGELKHTNEVMASIGADYFAKCSIAQADILRQHRIKDAQSKVEIYRKGKEYLDNQLSFKKENIYEKGGQEIVERYSEEEDKTWRVKHRENVRQDKIKSKNERDNKEQITDEELWNRLEELELQEELENELVSNSTTKQDIDDEDDDVSQDSFIIKEEDDIVPNEKENQIKLTQHEKIKDKKETITKVEEKPGKFWEVKKPVQVSKLDLLQKVIDRQNELDERLQELKNKERNRSKTEKDLMSRLDEMEQLDELEDEMDRLDNIIEGEDVDSDEDEEIIVKSPASVVKRSVSFADEDDSETIDITFKHSDVAPSIDTYNPDKGIHKPSDIYSAYSNLFRETTSILKKKIYSSNPVMENVSKREDPPKVTFMQIEEDDEPEHVNKTIVVGDVVERVDQNGNMMETAETRPTSLFKKKRMQKKT